MESVSDRGRRGGHGRGRGRGRGKGRGKGLHRKKGLKKKKEKDTDKVNTNTTTLGGNPSSKSIKKMNTNAKPFNPTASLKDTCETGSIALSISDSTDTTSTTDLLLFERLTNGIKYTMHDNYF